MTILLIPITISLGSIWILLEQNWCWSILGLEGLKVFGRVTGQYFSMRLVAVFDFESRWSGLGRAKLQNSQFSVSKSVKKSVKRGVRARRASVSPQSRSLFSASFQTFCFAARAYLNMQKYGLFCSLGESRN